VEIIGEDKAVDTTGVNTSLPSTGDEQAVYESNFEGVTNLVCSWHTLSFLPPGSAFAQLQILDLGGCTDVTSIPGSYNINKTLTTLNASGTKISSLPTDFLATLKHIDASNCKRITSIGDAPVIETLVISSSSINEIRQTSASSLIRLYALNSRITIMPPAPELKVLLWSGISSSSIEIEHAPTLLSILTPGPGDKIVNRTSDSVAITTLLTM
jgi:Leucine-rich repeat (LRR) protein